MSALRKRLYYYWKKLAEKRSFKQYQTVFFKEDLDRFNRCTTKKPASQIKQELKALHRYWNCYPFQYYRFDLYRRDCTLSLEQMKQYVPLFFFNKLFFPLSYKSYGILSFDKVLNYALLKAYDVPQPPMVAFFESGTFYDNANNPITAPEAAAIIQKSTAAKLFVKPRFGSEGKGIVVFQKQAFGFFDDQNRMLDTNYFASHFNDAAYVVQEGLTQGAEIARLYPHSVNTFRIITECINGDAHVLYALIRMGRGGNQVDNAASGGLYIKIDPQTGSLADYAYAHDRITFQQHPDTNFVFNDAVITCWPQVRDLALEVAVKFREIKYVGWDIAFSESGPSVIELNNSPDMAMIQDFYGGVRDDMKIKPEQGWYQSNFTIRITSD